MVNVNVNDEYKKYFVIFITNATDEIIRLDRQI